MTTTLITISEETRQDFATAASYHQSAGLSMAASAACMILAGQELARLHKIYGIKRGRPSGSEVNYRNPEGIKWGELVQQAVGISEDSAGRYMAMYEGAKKRLPALNSTDILNSPLSTLNADKRDQIFEAVRGLCDGQTATKLLVAWGITKAAPKPKGGSNGGGRPANAPESIDVIAQNRLWPIQESLGLAIMAPDWQAWLLRLPLANQEGDEPRATLVGLETELQNALEDVRAAAAHVKRISKRGAIEADVITTTSSIQPAAPALLSDSDPESDSDPDSDPFDN